MASAARLNARVARAEAQVGLLYEDELMRAYKAALGGLARDIADRFTVEATHTPVEALAAAGAPQSDKPPPPPRWVPPPGPALYAAVARAGAVKKIRSVQAAILTEMQNRVAIGFDVVGAPSQTLLDNLGARADEALSAAVREPVATAMANAYREGDTIVEAARAIRAAVNEAKPWQAVMLARTDLISISNGSALLQARALNKAAPAPIVTTKKWVATNDNRTRHTHREADGQEVPIDARFTVGNSQLDYPGDPRGSDSEVINCRCTVLLLDTPTTALRAAFDPSQPRAPAGSKRGGQWIQTIGGQYVPPAVAEWSGSTQRATEGTWSALDDELTFEGFRPQIAQYQGQPVFSPEGQFDPPPERGGVWWKAAYHIPTDELAVWVPNDMGGPHHFQMAEALGWESNGEIRDWDRRVDIMGTGYGPTASMDPTIDRFGDEDAVVLAKLRARLSTPKVERQLRQAQEFAIETEPGFARDIGVAAAGWDPSKHPREPGGSRVGGRWAKKAGASAPVEAEDRGDFSTTPSSWTGPEIAPWENTVEEVDHRWQEFDPDLVGPAYKGNQSVSVIAARHEVSAEEYRHLAAARAKEDLANAYVASNVPVEVLDDIVDSGRMKSQFETQTSRGTLSNGHRANTEENLYSYPADLPAEQRPIYGYMQRPGSYVSGASYYGEVQIEFKNDVRSRTTFTQGDSLAQGYIPSAIDDPSYLSLDYPVAFTNAANDTDVVRDGIWKDTPYVEAQIHGGVTLDDIAAVTFPAYYRETAEGIGSTLPSVNPRAADEVRLQKAVAALRARGVTVEFR